MYSDNLILGVYKYDQNDIINKEKFDEKLICGICLDILNNPQRCKQCKQDYCQACINKQIKHSNRCPQRCQMFGSWHVEKSSKQTINQLDQIKVVCKEPGCTKKIKLGSYQKHLKKDCQEVFVYCPNLACTFFTRKKYIQSHIKSCPLFQEFYPLSKITNSKKPVISQLQEEILYNDISRFNESKEYQKALEKGYEYGLQMQLKYGKYFENLPILVYQIGVIYFNQNKFLPALANLLKFEEIQESRLELRDKKEIQNSFTDVLFTIGYLYEELSQYNKAANYYERSLKQDISFQSNEDMSVLINLGHAYRLIGNYQKSYNYCIWAIKVFESEQGSDHSDQNKNSLDDIWKVYHNLTYTQYKYGDILESERTYQKLEEISKKIHGEDNSQYSETLLLQSQIKQEMGEHKKSIQIIKNTIQLRQKQLKPCHNDIVYSCRKQVQFYAKQGNFQEAYQIIDKEIDNIKQNKEDEETEKIWKYKLVEYERSKVLFRQKKFKEAKMVADQNCEQLLDIQDVQCMHSRILQCLGRIYFKNQDFSKSIDYLIRAKELIIQTFGKESYKHVKILIFMGQYYVYQKAYSVALRYLKESLDICKYLLVKDHPLQIKIMYKIAKIYKMSEKVNELKEILKEIKNKSEQITCLNQLELNKMLIKVEKLQKDLQDKENNKKINKLSNNLNKRKPSKVNKLEQQVKEEDLNSQFNENQKSKKKGNYKQKKNKNQNKVTNKKQVPKTKQKQKQKPTITQKKQEKRQSKRLQKQNQQSQQQEEGGLYWQQLPQRRTRQQNVA